MLLPSRIVAKTFAFHVLNFLTFTELVLDTLSVVCLKLLVFAFVFVVKLSSLN